MKRAFFAQRLSEAGKDSSKAWGFFMTSLGNRAKVLLLVGLLMTMGVLGDQLEIRLLPTRFVASIMKLALAWPPGKGAGLWFVFGLSWACISAVLDKDSLFMFPTDPREIESLSWS